MLASSLEDEFAQFIDFKLTYEKLQEKIPNCQLHLFQTGGHPAMLSNARCFSSFAKNFFGMI